MHEHCLCQSFTTGNFCPTCRAVIFLDFRGQPDTRKVHFTEAATTTTTTTEGSSTGPACVIAVLTSTLALELNAEKAKIAELEARDLAAQEQIVKLGAKVQSMRGQVEGVER